jgi:hypothetical protein
MTIVEWANRELAVLKGQLAYLNSGAARLYDNWDRDAARDRTTDCVTMIECQIGEWERLMAQNGIEICTPSVADN